MRNFIIGILLTLLIVLSFRYCENKKEQKRDLFTGSALIQQEINNVSKLIVSEGNFAQVHTYEDSENFLFDFFSSKKTAVIIVNAKVTVGYDLKRITTTIDEETKTITLSNLPDAEVNIYPELEFYDISNGYLNTFNAQDYNKIKQEAAKSVAKKIEESSLALNSQNRLISELQKIYILSNSLGWILKYEGQIISSAEEFINIKP